MDASIAGLVNDAMAVWNITGMAVGVIKHYEVVFSGGFGQAYVLANTSVTDRTLFQIASNSKAFTSMLVLELATPEFGSTRSRVPARVQARQRRHYR